MVQLIAGGALRCGSNRKNLLTKDHNIWKLSQTKPPSHPGNEELDRRGYMHCDLATCCCCCWQAREGKKISRKLFIIQTKSWEGEWQAKIWLSGSCQVLPFRRCHRRRRSSSCVVSEMWLIRAVLRREAMSEKKSTTAALLYTTRLTLGETSSERDVHLMSTGRYAWA